MKKLLLVSTLLILSVASFATTYYNKASGTAALEVPANWGTNVDGSGTAPSGFVTTSDIFNLSNGTSGTISSPWVITGVTLNVTGVFNLTIPAAFSLTGTGVVAVAAGGTLTLQNATNPTLGTLNATSTVNYNGTGAQTIAAATYGNLSLSGTRTGTPAISLGPGTTSTINVAGNFNVTYTGAVTFVTTGNTFNYSKLTGGCTIGGITYNILKQSNTSGTNTAGGNIVAQGTFTTTTGGTLDMGNLYTLAVTGAVSNSGTIKTGVLTTTSALPIPAGKSIKGTVIYTSLTGGQTIVSEIYYYGLQLLNTSGTNTAGGTFTIRAAFVTSPGGTLDMTSAYRMAIGTGYSLTNNGTITTSVLSTTSTSPLPSGVAWGGTGTIIYASATGGQSVMKGTYGCALTLANTSGTNTATGIITMNNTLTTTSGGIFSMSTYALNGTTPAVVNNGTISTAAVANPAVPAGLNWTGTTGNMIFAATAGLQFVPAGTYGTLKFSNTSGTNTAVGNLTVNTSLITTTGTGILALSTNQLLGGFTPTNNGTISTLSTASPCIPAGLNWTGTTGSIVFAALTGGQFIPQGTYKKLTFSNTSGTVAATGDIALSAGVLTTTAGGTLDMGTNVLSGTTTFTNAGTILTSSTSSNPLPAGITWAGTINYAATTGGQTVVAGTYNNLTLSNTSGTNTAGGNIVVNTGTMTTTAGGTLDMGTTGILSGSATFTNNGNIITSVPSVTSATPIPAGKAWGGTITYGATAGSQTIVSETSYNNLVLNNASGSNTSAGNQVVNGTLTTAGGTEDMGAFTLGGTLASITGGGTIRTANTSATPIATGKAWTQAIEYYTAAGGQTIVSGTYSGGLTNSNTSGTNTVVAAGAVSVPGDLTLTAGSTLADNGVTISVAGDIAGTGTHSGAGAISMTGSGATISGVTMGNLTLNNAGGFSTNDDATINGTLTLTAGKLNIGTNVLNFGASAPAVAGTPSVTKMIVATGGGQVRKLFSSNGSFLYPIGDASNYTPITLNFTGGTYAGGAYGGVTVTPSKQPQNANTTNFLKRYWSVATSGITSPVYQVTAATYAAADVTGTEGSMVLGAYNALPWIQPAGSTVNTGTHTLAATGTLTNTTVDITGVSGVHGTVVVTSPSSSVFCSGVTHQMDATPTGDPAFTYSWAPATGLSATTGATVIATPTVTGTVATVFTYTVTMTDGNGLTATGTHAVTVNPLPVISGINATCLASTTTLGTNISGTWTSSNSSIASVGSATGIVSGVALGNATITITAASTSCVSTVLVSVNATPSAILGATSVCSGSITTLGEAVSGGNWSSADPSLATVDAFGNVTGVASGTVNISYISGAGCFVTQPMTVGPLLPITGVLAACTGQNTTLNDASAGGTWSSGNMTIAIVGSSSGIVTGVSTGSVPITYTIGSGCFRTVNIAVNLAPTPITGSAAVCNGQTTTLSEAVPGGIWSSSNSAIASVGSTGVVSGVAVGNATITYMSGANCYATANATVNALPASITGTTSVCAGGSNTTLADATPSGTWSSSNSNATVGSSTGIVTGVTAGSSTITYTISTGCINTTPVTINALPAAITGTMTACAGLSSTLSDATGGGSWSSSNSGLATVGSSTGSVTGVASGNPVISYILSATGCASTTVFTVNPLPAAISGTTAVCIGLTTTLTDAGGGTWTSSNGNATIGSATGVVTGVSAGNSTITYTLPTTCRITTPVTVNSLPASIGGTAVACVAQSTTLTDGTPSGTWSSSNTGLATIGSSTGTVTGVAAGNPVITYMLVTGCIATKVATINALPGAISGTTTLCNGETSTLTDGTPSGTWSSSDVTNATIGSTSGIVNTVSSGPAIISYTLPTGCAATTTVSVNDVPSPIAGTIDVCIGTSATLTDPDGGGKWSSSNTSVATIGSSSGIINGLSVGTTMITYTFTASGCYISEGVNVDPYPGTISGNLIVCVGSVTDLDNTAGGGDWTSSATSKVTVDIVDGNATGVAAGTSTISYTLPTGCGVASIVTVTAMPALGSTTNTGPICAGGTLTLNANTATNVTAYAWSGPVAITSSTSAAATVPSATAGAAGVYSVTVTNGTGVGCARTYTTTAVVNTTPTAAPTNSGAICNGGTVTLNANPAGGATLYAWSGSNLSSSSVQNPTATPTVTTTYSVTVSKAGGSGCAPATVYTTIVTVNPTPAVSGGSNVAICTGNSTPLNATGASTYSWSPATALTATTGASITASPTSTITYTVTGTSAFGCVATAPVTVTVNALPVVSAGSNVAICTGNSTPLNATGASTYSWSPATALSATTGASVTASPTSTITYTVTGTNTNGCVKTSSVTVTVNALPVVSAGSNVAICTGNSTPLNATGASTYSWTPATALSATTGASVTASPTSTITYTVTGTNSNGCINTSSVTVTVNALPVVSAGSSVAICTGNSTPLNATGASTYSWSPATALSATTGASVTASPTSTITYTVTGTNSNGCVNTSSVTVTVNALPVVSAGSSVAICTGNSTPLNATGASTYSWSPATALSATTGASVTASPTSTITYTVTGTNSNGCVNTSSVTVTVNALPVVSAGSSVAICTGNSTPLNATGASIYSWSPATALSATTGASITASPTSTITYTVTGTNSNGCINTSSVTVTVNALPVVSAGSNVANCTGNSTPLNATGASTYSWSPATALSATTGASVTASPTSTITYTVTGTNTNGCVNTSSVTVTVNALPVVSAGSNVAICTGNSTPLNATGASTYSWSPATALSATTGASVTASPTSTITYTVTGTNTNGCVNTSSVTVTVNALPVVSAGSNVAICTGNSTPLNATGASTYSWSPATALSATTGASTTASPTSTITYTVTGINTNGCVNTSSVTVTVNALPVVSAGSNVAICTGNSTPLNATGASTYSWSPATALSATTGASITASPTSTITYTVTGTNSNGCVNTSSVTVTVNALPVVSAGSNVAICTGNSTPLNATGASTYSWSPATALSATTGASITASPTSTITYTVTGTNSNGCVNTSSVTVTVNALPVVSAGADVAICTGNFTPLNATGASTYSWSPATALSATTGASVAASPTSTITYTVTGTNSNGCVNTSSVTVTVNALPVVSAGADVAICTGNFTPLNATGASTYSWSPATALSATTGASVTASPTSTITYTVTGTNTNGCVNTSSVTVTVNALPVVSAGADVAICTGNSTPLNATGASTYSWSPATALSATTGASVTASPTSTITYTVTGTNTNGCVNTSSVTVTVNALPVVGAGADVAICTGNSTPLNATGASTYSWSPATALSATTGASVTASPTSTITYTVTGTNTNGCINTSSVTVTVNALPVVSAGADVAICTGNATPLNATGASTYSWSPATALSTTTGASVTASPTSTITYTVTGTNTNGCVNTSSVTVTVNALPVVSAGADVAICTGNSTPLNATGASTYSWSPATALSATTGASVTASPTSTITYTVTGTNSNGCVNTSSVTVTVNALPATTSGTASVCIGSVTTLSNSGGGTWSSSNPGIATAGSATGDVTGVGAGTATITYTLPTGCITTTPVTVNALPVVGAGSGVAICTGNATALNATGAASYTWTPGTALSSTTGSSVTASPTATTTYSVTGTNGNGCATTASITVTVNALPIVSGGADIGVCAGSSAPLGATGAVSYSWSPATGLSATTGASVTVTPSSAVTYTITGTSGAGCVNTATVSVSVNPLPSVGTSSPATICNATTSTLTATGGATYAWSPSAGLSATTGASVVASPSVTTTYTVTGTSSLGCSSNSSVTLSVLASPVISAIGSGSAICAGNTLNITSAASGGTSPLAYSWSGPAAFSAAVQNPSIASATTAAIGTYTLTVTDANGCAATGTNVTTATVNPLPSSGTITGANAVCLNSTITLSDAVTGGVWTSSSALATVGSTSGVVTGAGKGTLNITYTVTNIYSCSTFATTTISVVVTPGNIYTLAGNGVNATTGNGGAANLASVQGPRAITTDAAGNVYFCDVTANVIRKVNTAGIITTVAGSGVTGTSGDGGPATAAQLSMSGGGGIAVDASGNMYIANTFVNTIRKVDVSTGIITKIAGTGTAGFSGDGGDATAAKLYNPMGLCIDSVGNIYFADQSNFRVRRIDPSGIISTVAGTGSNSYSGDGGPGTAARVSYVRDVVLDHSGNMYIADATNNVIRKYVFATGIITTLAGNGTTGSGGDGGPATACQFNVPARISYDGGSIIFVADQNNNKIRKIDLLTGKISTVVANGGTGYGGDGGAATASQVWIPCGVASDKNGYIYIADANNRRVRIASGRGSISIAVAGPTLVAAGTTVVFSANAAVNNMYSSLQWQKNGVNVGTGAATYSDIPSHGDVYRCILTVSPECTTPFSDTSNLITMSLIGYRQSNTTAVEEAQQASAATMHVFPNPVRDQINVEAANVANGNMQINVFDQTGRVVMSRTVLVTDNRLAEQFDMQSLAMGMYVVSLTDSAEKTMVVRCVKN